MKKIKARVVYRDATHDNLEWHLAVRMKTLQSFVDKGDENMAAYVQRGICAIAEAMYIAGCFNLDRLRYIEDETNRIRGWI